MRFTDRASSLDVRYTARDLSFHDGRWSARITVTNRTNKPLYEASWTVPGEKWSTWNGPALVYSGLDVLLNRRLIYVSASSEVPAIPYPLRPGVTWSGVVEGVIPPVPKIPHDQPIWIRYPVFGIGQPWDGENAGLAVQWISVKAVQL